MFAVPNEYKQTELRVLGTFEVKSGKLIVSDPCYSRGTWCQGDLENVRTGKWTGLSVYGKTDWGNRVWEVRAVHADYPIDLAISEKTDLHVGVDSGQAGIFDAEKFAGGEDSYGDGGWYDECCNLTNSASQGGILAGGVVTSSGFGDGVYECFITRDNGKIVAAKVVFVMREEDCEDEE